MRRFLNRLLGNAADFPQISYMSLIGLNPFDVRCPDIADRETRSILVPKGAPVPEGEYCLQEYYCQEPHCDCRRVILQVRERSRPADLLASISFAWGSPEFYARKFGADLDIGEMMSGAFLDPFLPQSRHAKALFDLLETVSFKDEDYVRRLMRHYKIFRRRGTAKDGP